MMKRLIKTFLTVVLILITTTIYLSSVGIKTNKFNNQIKNSILEINNKFNLKLSDVTYKLNLNNFSINITTKKSQLLIENSKIDINNIKTNVSLKSLINDQFSIDDLQISTAEVKINDLISLTRAIHNTPQLFILNKIIKEGSIEADININFDNQGKVKDNYQIKGFVKNTRLDLLNKSNVKDLSFSFDVTKNKYLLNKISATFNKIKLNSPLIQIEKKKDLYAIDGTILNEDQNLDSKDLKPILGNLFKGVDIKKVELSSRNNFSFTINKKLKFNDLIIETTINLGQLIFTDKNLNLELFLLNPKQEIKLEDHKIKINFEKDQLTIDGKGDIFLTDNIEQLSYKIVKDDNQSIFNTKLNIKNNSLTLEFLDYEKKKGVNSTILINGNLKKMVQ